jgi:E3 ubiquitin-protein ligase RNF115/126
MATPEPSSPRRSPRESPRSPAHPFLDHNPWADTGNTEFHEFGNGGGFSRRSYRSPDGRFAFTSTTYSRGFPSRRVRGGLPDILPGEDPVIRNFNAILQGLTGALYQGQRDTTRGDDHPPWADTRDDHDEDRGRHPFHGGLWPRDADQPQPMGQPLGDMTEYESSFYCPVPCAFFLFLNRPDIISDGIRSPSSIYDILGSYDYSILDLFRPDFPHDGHAPGGRPVGRGGVRIMGGIDPLSIITSILGGRHGDAVYSQEELDRVVSQLIDQNMNGNGAPPAAQSAIQALPKKKVDKEMLGTEGKAECSICMEPVDLGTEVTVLPCKHWFHYQCIEMWLNQHNTCPHCRRGINNNTDQ